jgi:hypothetical protein
VRISRRVAWSTVGAAAFVTLSALWFISHYDRETFERRTTPQPEALRNPWLAAERLLVGMGWRVQTAQEAAALDTLPPGGALILSADREYHLTPSRAAALLAWVDAGGYLIADAAFVARSDPVLEAFDVRTSPPRRERRPKSEDRDERDDPPPLPPGVRARNDVVRTAVGIPGYGRVLRMLPGLPLYAAGVAPSWRVPGRRDRDGNPSDEMLEFDYGRGHVTLINGLWRFQGPSTLEREDHAEILVALLATHGGAADVRIITRLTTPNLFAWLARNATAALVSAAALLLLWLWRIVPRFGVVRPAPAAERRSLVQHLRAMGRFLWRRHAGDALLDAARANLRRRLAQRGVAAADAALPEACAAVEHALGVSAREVAHALGGGARTPDQFTAAMATLAALDHRLDDLRTA